MVVISESSKRIISACNSNQNNLYRLICENFSIKDIKGVNYSLIYSREFASLTYLELARTTRMAYEI